MGRLNDRVAIVTGAGRGLGRSHAHFLAREGASVVVNDLGTDQSGAAGQESPPNEVVREIRSNGGRAIASHHDVSDWNSAGEMIRVTIEEFGDLHVLVNNAGNIRDRTLANMTEAEWDVVIKVHLKGHGGPTHHAMAYWRDRAKAGHRTRASIVHTSSVSGLAGNFGQGNYAAAKLGIVGLSRVAALEGKPYGIRSNVVSPSARTRLALSGTPGGDAMFKPPDNPAEFDHWDPGNVSPLIGWLAEENCPATSQIYHVMGKCIRIFSMPAVVHELVHEGRWTLEALDHELPERLVRQTTIEDLLKYPG